MKTFVFMNQFRYDRVNYHQYFDPQKHRFVFLQNEEFYERFPEEYRNLFGNVVMVETFSIEALRPILEQELTLVSNPEDVRLICWDEELLLLAGQLRQEFKLHGSTYDQLLPFRDKLYMKELLRKEGIRVPRFTSMTNAEAEKGTDGWFRVGREIDYPMIAKPFDGAGSVNTARLNDETEFLDFCKTHQHLLTQYDFEEFIEGTFYHCDSFIYQGEIQVSEVCEYTATGLEFIHGKPLGSIRLPEGDIVRESILNFNQDVLKTLQAPDGCTHMEVFYTSKGEVIFIEVAARASGGEVLPAYKRGMGLDFYDLWMRLELGEHLSFSKQKSRYTGWIYYPSATGVIRKLNTPTLKTEHTISWKVGVGQVIEPSRSCFERIGLVELISDDYQAIREDMNNLVCFQAAEVEN